MWKPYNQKNPLNIQGLPVDDLCAPDMEIFHLNRTAILFLNIPYVLSDCCVMRKNNAQNNDVKASGDRYICGEYVWCPVDEVIFTTIIFHLNFYCKFAGMTRGGLDWQGKYSEPRPRKLDRLFREMDRKSVTARVERNLRFPGERIWSRS